MIIMSCADFEHVLLLCFSDRSVLHSVMEHLMINCNGKDTEVGFTNTHIFYTLLNEVKGVYLNWGVHMSVCRYFVQTISGTAQPFITRLGMLVHCSRSWAQ